MSIRYLEEQRQFHLQAGSSSYILQVYPSGHVVHLYWGAKVRALPMSHVIRTRDRAFSPNPNPPDRSYSLDALPLEYPGYGNSDFRQPAYQIQLANGTTVTDLKYISHDITAGKPALEGLPSTYVEAEDEADTLKLLLEDALTGLRVELSYTAYRERNVITRSSRIVNGGTESVRVLRALSASVDFPHHRFDLLTLPGAWARERYIERRALASGTQSVESRRGASSHQQNPFVALLGKDTTEERGEAYGFNLVYSGSFLASAEVDQWYTTRVSLGINPFDFSWLLEPGAAFQTPEAVMVYSAEGLTGMSQTYHELYRTRLCRGEFRDKPRPVLINNWEATYFDFTAEKIEDIAKAGRELGIELFVLDDGWFGRRNDDTTSLGDWFVDKAKLPQGLDDLAQRVKGLGLQFGLWFEPEMISVDSELYRSHPDWCLHVPDRVRSEGRNQLILDLSRPEVCDYIVETVSGVLAGAPISYVKWDMNRHMTEIGSAALPPERQRETAHRYMLGLYSVMERITTAFPHVLFESCSGGGGRFDPGILHYMPQTWTSDNTDAVSRLKIQYGTSIVYPVSAMGAHISAVPNHQVHRMTSLKMRGDVAMSGNFGYELDLTKFTPEEKELAKAQVALYKELRQFVQFGRFYRLISPFEELEAAWMFVSESGDDVLACYFNVLAEPNEPYKRLKLRGLDPAADYTDLESGEVYGGDELMHAGISLPVQHGDFESVLIRLRKVQ
ncbi:alpha-galactosidase AgaN [Paenibacillus mucilaginosus 3016]|uniref:Alpha-galactosidase n=1 Tax=Paenibacillus mucilaginosus 3016 TaxID=1116391 RepID=H6NPK2_9BACL|nr:alpha-galactosidase [Paenibacillus mucilaginosus]AFC32614.1 alpha-galactosidase AgaN [Paenibacillus mucilaginosus 3016]WFA21087.1 alpha-galactosidase [Paenibacillus mucilaginosus]